MLARPRRMGSSTRPLRDRCCVIHPGFYLQKMIQNISRSTETMVFASPVNPEDLLSSELNLPRVVVIFGC